jgi:uncharacterized iron-regulated protein
MNYIGRICCERFSLIFIFMICLVNFSAATAQSDKSENEWQSPLYTDHPLVGSIWNTSTRSRIDQNQLFEAINNSRYFLLGEKHDNLDHHTKQLQILERLLQDNRLESLSLEMMDSTVDSQLAELSSQSFSSTDELRDYLAWDTEGWPWQFYGPLIQSALNSGVALKSANISSEKVGEIYGQELDEEVASVLPASAVGKLNEEIDASHCGLLPASQFPAMVNIQRTRDQQMALSLTSEAGTTTPRKIKMLVAGNYHIRRDLSVPNYLLALDSSVTADQVVTLALLEVSPESEEPLDYLQAYSEVLPYDYVWFTPALTDEDYCASLQ